MKYVTRANVHVDRCSSAWLIRRFVDPAAEFAFVAPGAPVPEGITFDMDGATWGHDDDRCTFETILHVHGLTDPVLTAIGAIIHGADIAPDFDRTLESPGIDLLFRGVRLTSSSDAEAIEFGARVMDALYAAISAGYRR